MGRQPGSVCIGQGDILEPWEYSQLNEYLSLVLRKIERGRAEYGMDYLKRTDADFAAQIDAENADEAGWAAMRFIARHAPADVCRQTPGHVSHIVHIPPGQD